MVNYFSFYRPKHVYTLTTVGLKKSYDKTFYSREAANEFMYEVCSKNGIRIVEVYDDKHDKTYKCTKGVKFFIQRA